MCATWENGQGRWKIYLDGDFKKERISGAGKKFTNGALYLGQEQDSYKGGFSLYQSFQGNLTNVNLWNRVLSQEEIKDQSRSCILGEGNILKWTDFVGKEQGNVRVECSHACV